MAESDPMYAMVDRWLSTTPADDEKALVLKEASADAILKAASLSKMSAFNKLNRRFHKLLDKLGNSPLKDDLVKEVERMRAVRQEAEQLYGPLARKDEEVGAAGKPMLNLQLAFLTQVPTHIPDGQVIDVQTLPQAQGTELRKELQP